MGVEIDGLDATVAWFALSATKARAGAPVVAVKSAAKAADRMRAKVPIDEGDLLDSITSDPTATLTPAGAYADAGPSRTANPGAFKAHLIERGTVKMGPSPFMQPAGDETLPDFEDDMRKLL